jgi:antitoxin Phd
MEKELTMRHFSATELANKTGDVLAAASQEPVHIQRHGKSRFVLLSLEQFERLATKSDARRSLHLDQIDESEAEHLISALERSIQHD